MSDLIELVCECGKVLRVPKSRAGQTGKCAQCKRPVLIPADAGMAGTSSLAEASETYRAEVVPNPLATTGKRNMAAPPELSKTMIRMSPFATPPQVEPDEGQNMASIPFPTPAQGEFGTTPATSFSTPPMEEGKQCGHCGNMSRFDAEFCEYCREPFEMEIASSTPAAPLQPVYTPPPRPAATEKIATAKKEAKPSKTGKQTKSIKKQRSSTSAILLSFLFGLMVGVAVSPGYLDVMPSWQTIYAFVAPGKAEQPLAQIDTPPQTNTNTPNTTTTTNPKTPEIEMPLKSDDTLSKLKSSVDGMVNNVEVYLFALRQPYQQLRDNVDALKREFPGKINPAIMAEAEKVLENGAKWEKTLKQRVDFGKNASYRQEEDKLRQAETYLKEAMAKNLHPENNIIIQELRRAVHRVSDERTKLSRDKAMTSASQTSVSQYMGTWFTSLRSELVKVEEIANNIINLSLENQSAGLKLETVGSTVKKMLKYSDDIKRSAQNLEKLMGVKSVHAWISWRRASANSQGQKRQADILDSFIKTKKFELDIKEDLPKLKRTVATLQKDAEKGVRITEDVVRSILSTLQAIHRKYEEPYQDFDSAITNFEFWEPK